LALSFAWEGTLALLAVEAGWASELGHFGDEKYLLPLPGFELWIPLFIA